MRDLILVLAGLTLVYFLVLNTIYLVFTAIAWVEVTGHLRRRRFEPADEVFASPLTPGISILLPAFNEDVGVVDAVRSLLALRYPLHEVIVTNDGSTDRTLEVLREAFDLVPVRKALRTAIPTAPVRATYVSRTHASLCVIDKENGGKADALNAALSAARHPYVCAVDGDSLIEEEALLRVALPVLENPGLTVATGGMVRIANGCRVEPAPTCAWRRISVSPTTEISADSFNASCQTLPSPGIAKRNVCGATMRRNSRRRDIPTARAASSSPFAIAPNAPRKTSPRSAFA